MSSFVANSQHNSILKRRAMPNNGISLVMKTQKEPAVPLRAQTRYPGSPNLMEPDNDHDKIKLNSRDRRRDRCRNTTNQKRCFSFEENITRRHQTGNLTVKHINHAQVLNKCYELRGGFRSIVRRFNRGKQGFVSPRCLQKTIQKLRLFNKSQLAQKRTLVNSHALPVLSNLRKKVKAKHFPGSVARRAKSPTYIRIHDESRLSNDSDQFEDGIQRAVSRQTHDQGKLTLEPRSIHEFIKKYDAELKMFEKTLKFK
ncbi:unnamed protein product [Moneuplotes crassus]|uniref:Uncharacterized protein n=1 Tax=Euplotes crassus TaxID=5936 RepID=A0AAD1XRM6_EUPCR|nr:unnamed protein product [Moneuplotes crassus]